MIAPEQKYIDLHTHSTAAGPDVFALQNFLVPTAPETGFYSAGIHPKDAELFDIKDFETIWNNPRCLAVGECGMDRRYPDLPKQSRLFRAQAQRADALHKPLLIHSVRTHEEICRAAKDLAPAVPWIIHGFRGKERTLFSLLDAGFFISFGAGLLKDAGNLELFFSRIPADRIFFETDDDDRADIRAIYALAASMRGVPVDELCMTVQKNFRRIFHAE